MRIAQVMLARGFGGAERSFVDLSLALAARGHEVLAIGDGRGAALPMLAGRRGISLVSLRCHGNWDLLARRRLRQALEAFAPKVVQAHLARAALLAGHAAHALGLPTVAKTHNLVDARYYRDIDLLVPTTAAQAAHLRAQGVAEQDLRLIPNFSPLEPLAARVHAAGPPWRLKTFGRFVAKKGFACLLDATAALRAAGVDVRLDVGGDGPENGALRARAASLGIADRVCWPGWITDVPAFLADAHLFVLPSHDEPFGIVLLEAMACGTPIVTTPTAGPREILDADTACFAARDDAAALADALTLALGDYALCARRAQAALERFRARYSAEVITARYLDAYAELAGREPRRREA
ncbi:MAG: glycosyltransferase [Gammaproteobacteria bacterium]